MGTLTADCPRLDSHCPHKLATSCRLTSTPNCCACADERPHSRLYRVYVDGVGFVQRGTRWQSYCWFCKEFWTNRLAATDPPLEASQTQIPHVPDQAEFLERWFEFHQGYRVVRNAADGTESRIAVIGEPFREVSPGFLPRTLAQLRAGRINDASRPENRIRRRRLTSEEEGPDEQLQENIENAIDNLLAEISDEETPTPEAQTRLQGNRSETSSASVIPAPSRHFERLARVFGTREDIQRDDYESPLATLYNRAEARYQQAEERRANGIVSAPPNMPGINHMESQAQSFERSSGDTNLDTIYTRGFQSQIPRLVGSQNRGHVNENNTAALSNENVNQEIWNTGDSASFDVEEQLRQQWARDKSWLSSVLDRAQHASGGAIIPSTVFPEGRDFLYSVYFNPDAQRRRLRGLIGEQLAERSDREHDQQEQQNREEQASGNTATLGPDGMTMDDSSELGLYVRELRRFEQNNSVRNSAYPWLFGPGGPLERTSGPRTIARHFLFQSTETLDNPKRPPPLTDAEMTRNLACQVCYVQISDIALVPCGHLCMCVWCADLVVPLKNGQLQRPTKCPMCRKDIKQRIKVYIRG